MIHLGFRKYKNSHKGATFVIIGSGPSMLQ